MTDKGVTIRAVEKRRDTGSRDRVMMYAVVCSVLVHLAVLGLIAKTYASRLNAPAVVRNPRYIKVDLVDLPENQPAKPKRTSRAYVPPVPMRSTREAMPNTSAPGTAHSFRDVGGPADRSMPVPPSTKTHADRAQSTSPPRTPGNPGGRLNVGSVSAHGDLGGGWSNGRTHVGWVPGSDDARGTGSGSGAGVGTPDPPKHADEGPGARPAPAPVVAPAPPPVRTVSLKVCVVSGDLPNDNCRQTRSETFVEGQQPTHRCTRCKAPEPVHVSTRADRKDPMLVKDSRPSIPSSVDEGLSVSVRIEYTVGADGGVSDIQVTKSSGNRAIDRAVSDSARRLKYEPAVQDGVPRAVKKTREYQINT